jgi:Flp pilus assembly protein TadD
MTRFIGLIGLVWLLSAAGAAAQGPEDQYMHIYSLLQEADHCNDAGQAREALAKYTEAQAALAKFPTLFPGWNENLIRFRLNYVTSKLAPLMAALPAATNLVSGTRAGGPTAPVLPGTETNSLIRQLQDDMSRLQSENATLAAKLKEALSVQPSKVDPREIARAEEKNRSLQKENELLKVTLNQQEEKASKAPDPQVLAEANRALEETRSRLQTQEQALSALRTENELLKKEAAAARSRQDSGSAKLNRQLEQSRESLAALQKQHDSLRAEKSTLDNQVKDLEKRLAQASSEAADQQRSLARKAQELQEALDKQTAAAQAAARQSEERLRQLEGERAQLASEKTALEARLAQAPAPGGGTPGEATRLKQLQEEMARQAEVSRKALLESEERAGRFEKELARLTKEKFDLEERLAKGAGPTPESESRKIKKLREEKAKQAAAAKLAAKESKERIAQLEEEVSRLAKAKSELDSRLADEASEAAKAELKKRKQLEEQVADLRSKLEKAEKQLSKRNTDKGSAADVRAQIETLKARVEILEAKPEPFTAEELAVLRTPSPRLIASASQDTSSSPPAAADPPAAAQAKPPPAKRGTIQLPPGTGALDAAAQAAFRAGRFEEAEKKYLEILPQDEKNVYVLGNLASTQIELNKLQEAEKHLTTALQVDPQDDYCLYLKGRVRYKQEKLDEALDLLSQAVKRNPDSAETQNHLGMVLAEKGLRTQAEAAFRKAIQLQPGYALAHKNLAFVYATQKPPAVALARWHYQRAIVGGLPRNSEMEKLLGL